MNVGSVIVEVHSVEPRSTVTCVRPFVAIHDAITSYQ